MPLPQHTRLINTAAKAALAPLGCIQKGRSRTWLDDHGWWVGVVEFQPSSHSKGSYLNVGACWLWYEKDHLSFDAGHRMEAFQPYSDDAQFAAAATTLAERASQEVTALRERFASPALVQAWHEASPSASFWTHYHRAVAAGLAGNIDQSRHAFAAVIANTDDRTWAIEAKRRAAELMRCLEVGDGFEAEIMNTVRRTRALLKLQVRDSVNQSYMTD